MCITLTPNATCYYLKIRVDLSGQSAFSKEAEAIKAIQNLFDQIFPKEPTEETLDPAVSLYKLSEKAQLFSIVLSYPGLAIIGLQPNQEKSDSVFHLLLEKLKKTPPKEFTTQEYVQSYMTAFLERLRI